MAQKYLKNRLKKNEFQRAKTFQKFLNQEILVFISFMEKG